MSRSRTLIFPPCVTDLGKSDNFTKCQKKSPPRKHSGIIARTHRSMAFEALGLLVPAARSRRCSFCRRCFTASGSARGVRALHQDASCVGEAISAQEVSAAGSRVRATPPRVPGSSDLHVPQCQRESAPISAASAPPQRSEGRCEPDARQRCPHVHVVYSASAQDSHSLLVACARNVYRNIQCNRYLCTHDRYHERWYVQRASLEGARGSVPKQGLSHAYFHKVNS